MARKWVIGLAVLGALGIGSLAMAQEPERAKGMRRPMRRTMAEPGGGGIAAWGGSIYLLRGGRLQKLNADLEVLKTVELPLAAAPGPRAGGGLMAQHRRMMRQRGGRMGRRLAMVPLADEEEAPEAAPAPGPRMPMGVRLMMRARPDRYDPVTVLALREELELTDKQVKLIEKISEDARGRVRGVLNDEQRQEVEGLQMPPAMPGMMGGPVPMPEGPRGAMGGPTVVRGGMDTTGDAHLAADEAGVYLMGRGRITVYDHELNEVRSADLEALGPPGR